MVIVSFVRNELMQIGCYLINYRQFKHFNSTNFRNDILAQPWDDIKTFYDPNDMWKKWKDLFISVCNRHAPLRTKRTRSSKSPWITTVLKKRMNFRDRLKKKAIKTGDPSVWNQFRKTKTQVNREIKSAERPTTKVLLIVVLKINVKLGKRSTN